jgi:hypothetical protein
MRIDSSALSIAPYDSKYQAQYCLYEKEPSETYTIVVFSNEIDCFVLMNTLEFKENLRMRLIVDIGHLLGRNSSVCCFVQRISRVILYRFKIISFNIIRMMHHRLKSH